MEDGTYVVSFIGVDHMPAVLKKVFTVVLSVIFAAALLLPAISFAESDEAVNGANNTEIDSDPTQNANQSGDEAIPPEETPSDNCVATIKYYENVIYEEPGIPADSTGRYLLGTRTIAGLSEGSVLDAWDYVVSIPGYFFFDGWPGKLTVSTDSDKNIIELFYFRYSNYSYSVNYYVLTGADLSADTWNEALKPDSVRFTQIGSEAFENRPYGELVKGTTYEYPIDGLYVVDAYPSEIRVGVDGGSDAINILYIPENATLPDDVEVPEFPPEIDNPTTPDFPVTPDKPAVPAPPTVPDIPTSPDEPSNPDDSVTPDNPSEAPTLPDEPIVPNEPVVPPLSNGSGATDPGPSLIGPILPNGGASTENGIKLPSANDSTDSKANGDFENVDRLFRNYIDSERESGAIEITDDMLDNPVDPKAAQNIIDAYKTGYENGAGSVESQNAFNLVDHIICIILIIIFAILAMIGFALYGRERQKFQELKNAANAPEDQTSSRVLNNSPDEPPYSR